MLAVTCILRKAPGFTRSPTHRHTRTVPVLLRNFALEVDHGEFLARYGEIRKTTTVKEGDKIHAGEQIAKVGDLIGIQVPSDMLHPELYDKTASGPLTITDANRSKKRSDGIPLMRRMDLVDPTSRLNQWQVRLPKAQQSGT
jgi:murein DD-endopeptidase MepM/ murein hydrolase activator NlpD